MVGKDYLSMGYKIMKLGDMRSDVDISNRTAQNFLGKYTERALTREGKRLYKKHPEYEYLKEDPFLNDPWKDGYEFDETEFYNSVVYAYMAEQFLRQKPEFNKKYQEIIKERKNNWNKSSNKLIKNNIDKIYSSFNGEFFSWYSDYLREQADPGILERERKQWEQEQKNLQIAHDMRKMQAKIQTQQDLASGKRVICPYCKSTNTEKISTVSRAVSVSLVGAASGKIGKQWHCNNCKSDF